ncbi:MAG: ABC transporter permease subunit [Chloroflexia bacterium]|nr:ABC transporter permease subunit [Chloroflexia bacterium]
MTDILTVMWKEAKCLFRHQGSRLRYLLTWLSPLALAVYSPLDTGLRWIEAYTSLFVAFLIPLILVSVTVPDSFAGERERHTLETLLASRLDDQAILFGKLGLAVAVSWGTTLLVLLLSLVTVNVTHWQGHILFYRPAVALADLVFSLLVTVLIASTGVLISLHTATAQEAAQMLMAAFMLPPMVLAVVAFLFSNEIHAFMATQSPGQILLAAGILLALLDLAVVALVRARFRRARLVTV